MYMNVMKKAKEGKENRRNGANFFKYVQPQSFGVSQQSKSHFRSLLELDQNSSRYQQSARLSNNKQIHHSSLGVPSQQVDSDSIKSHSLKKFLSIFGGPAILNHSSSQRTNKVDEKQTQKLPGRQVFTCSIKNANVSTTNGKDRDQNHTSYILTSRREKTDSSILQHQNSKAATQDIISDLKRTISQGKEREKSLREQVESLKKQRTTLQMEIDVVAESKQTIEQKFRLKQVGYLSRIQQLQRQLQAKEKCRQHELIIESLKKVINEQLKKIIELQKLKVEREEIDKLEQKINKNISIANQTSTREKLRLIQNQSLLRSIDRKKGRTLTIQEEVSQTEMSSPIGQPEIYEQTIQEVTEQEEKDSFSKMSQSAEDSILEEVDKYLARWRNKP